MKVSVIGSGAWGTALALVLFENGNDVTVWSYMEDESKVLAETRENPLLKGVDLPSEMKFTSDLACVADCEVVVLATPSFAVRGTVKNLRPNLKAGTILISVSKGIEKDSSLPLSEVIREEVGEGFPIVALTGPSHAEEVGRHIPTTVVSACEDIAVAEKIQDLFMNPRFRVYTSDDVVGVELAGALKNIIALCAGCCDGLGMGDNTKAALMTRGLAEIARLVVAMGGRKDTISGLAGVGDLIVTCTSMHSRNRRAGIMIGEGMSTEEAIEKVGAVVEGYYAAATAKTLAEKLDVEMPIAKAAYEVLYEGRDLREAVDSLMRREKRPELEVNA